MNDILAEWINLRRAELEAGGFRVTINEPSHNGSRSADLDNALAVGTITHWPGTKFEFQFNDCKNGAVLVLEERDFLDVDNLNQFFNELLRNKLRGLQK